MKNVKRLIVLLVFVLLLLPIKVLADENIIFTNEETNYSVIIDDKADLISEEDEARLKDTMIGITKYANVIFLSTDSNPSTAKSYADDYILSRYRNENGVIFLIDMDNRIIWLAATGNTRSIITNGKAESITDNVFRYASSKEYPLKYSEHYTKDKYFGRIDYDDKYNVKDIRYEELKKNY